MKKSEFTRRKFLASGMAIIPIPFLESFMTGPLSAAVIAPTTPAKRMVFLGMGFGVTESTWYPDVNELGTDYKLPAGLAPLARHKSGFSIIQNLYHKYSRNGHSGSTFWLTGANQYAMPGKSFHNTVSVDQVAAAEFGLHTRYRSLEFAGKNTAGAGAGHGPGLSLAWDQQGKPIQSIDTPNKAFHRLFSNPKISIEEQRANIAEKRSVLDTVVADARSLKHKVNHNDGQKLEEYLDSIRDIEARIAKEEKWIGVPQAKPNKPITEPRPSLEGLGEIRVMYDLMVAAMQVDATRVLSYRMPADTLLQSIGANETAHLVSHYSEKGGSRKEISRRRNFFSVKVSLVSEDLYRFSLFCV